MMMLSMSFGVEPCWIAKASLFRGWRGSIMRWLGGVEVDRSKSHNVVEQVVEQFRNHERFLIMITPEGTRKRADYWRSGFYYIALEAKVPILMGFFDFKRKAGGFGPLITLTGDVEVDMAKIRDFYQHVTGKYPENTSPMRLRPHEDKDTPD